MESIIAFIISPGILIAGSLILGVCILWYIGDQKEKKQKEKNLEERIKKLEEQLKEKEA